MEKASERNEHVTQVDVCVRPHDNLTVTAAQQILTTCLPSVGLRPFIVQKK